MEVLRSLVPLLSAALVVPLWSASIPLRLESNLPLIEVRLNGAGPYLFLLDTGADGTMATPSAMESAGLLLAYRIEIAGAAGKETVGVSPDADLQIGDLTVRGVEVLRHNLQATRRVHSRIQGVLGQNVLRRMNYLIDYENRRMLIGDEASVAAESLKGRREQFQRIGNRVAMEAMPSGRAGVALTLILDSGASGMMLHDRGPGVRGATLFRGTAFGDEVQSTCGTGYVTRARLAELAVGGHKFSDLPVALMPAGQTAGAPREDGLLPAGMFRAFYVNNREQYVIVSR